MANIRDKSLKLLGSLRGPGVLEVSGKRYAVAYELDRYQSSVGQRADGSLNGDLAELAELDERAPAILILEHGPQVQVLISNADRTGADVEIEGPISAQ